MGYMKELAIQSHGHNDIFTIEDSKRGIVNPYVGCRVRVEWLKQWGGKPAGFVIEGILQRTFCVGGRTLVGEVMVEGVHGKKKISCPWSKNWISVEIF